MSVFNELLNDYKYPHLELARQSIEVKQEVEFDQPLRNLEKIFLK